MTNENVEHSLHNLFINVEPSSELNVMPNNVTGEDPNHSILGYVLLYQLHSQALSESNLGQDDSPISCH
jgi:hypothetical protein